MVWLHSSVTWVAESGFDVAPPGLIPFLSSSIVAVLVAILSWLIPENSTNDLYDTCDYARLGRPTERGAGPGNIPTAAQSL